jgi:dolichyl-phosphate beta-glucosyltransferase
MRAVTTVAPSVAIVIPSFNEQARLGDTLREVANLGRSRGSAISVVLADDGSSDGTVALAEAVARQEGLDLAVLRLPHKGKAGAVRSGMLHAATATAVEYLLMLDADNEIAVDQLAAVDWSGDPSTIYIGRRVGMVGDRHGVRPTLVRRLMSTGMRVLSRLLLGLPFSDSQCGFKLFPRELVGGLFGQQRSRGWVFDAEILVIAARSGIAISEVPVVWSPRGVSRVRPTAAVSSVFDLLAIAGRKITGAYKPVGGISVLSSRS